MLEHRKWLRQAREGLESAPVIDYSGWRAEGYQESFTYELGFHLLIYQLARPPEFSLRDIGPAFRVTDSTDHLSFFLILHLGININPRDLPKTLTKIITAAHGACTSRPQGLLDLSGRRREGGREGDHGGGHAPFELVDDEHGQPHKHHGQQHQHGRAAVGWSEVHQRG